MSVQEVDTSRREHTRTDKGRQGQTRADKGRQATTHLSSRCEVVNVLLLLEQRTLHFEKMVQRKSCQAHAVVETTDLAKEDFPVFLE
jgi:hypothetical protein